MTGGSPCQDLSHAGKRKGMTEGTRSNLWVAMREGIRLLRPHLVIWENVRGALSTAADSELVARPGLLDDVRRRGGEPVLRAAGRVVGDLAELGYDARWHCVRASDVGAPHARLRIFVVATDASVDPWWELDGDGGAAARAGRGGELVGLLPTPTTQDGSNNAGPSQFGRNTPPLNAAVTLLPTPAVVDMGERKTPDEWDAWTARMREEHDTGNGHGNSLSVEARRLLPTPVTDPLSGNGHARDLGGEVKLMPTPEAKLGTSGPDYARMNRPGTGSDSLHEFVGRLMPTPNASDHKGSGATSGRDRDGRPRPAGDADLPEVASKLLPTPRGTDGAKGGPNQAGSSGDFMLPSAVQPARLLPSPQAHDAVTGKTPEQVEAMRARSGAGVANLNEVPLTAGWGEYASAIARWAAVIGRPAPSPTEVTAVAVARYAAARARRLADRRPVGMRGPIPKRPNPQLAPAFVEWMMGLPAGWVTSVAITRNEQLKALGNGVVPQQAAHAIATMLTWRLP